MNTRNITYQSKEIETYYSNNRITWEQFYPSEQKIFCDCKLHSGLSVLDIGCGCGGLGLALKERFLVTQYTGVDISSQAIDTAKKMNPDAIFFAGDILSIDSGTLKINQFDVVTALSCIDWNVEFDNMLSLAWDYVKPGGKFISTFRLTELDSVNADNILHESYQHINFSGLKMGEKAPYFVINAQELINKLLKFNPKTIVAHGYWGAPSVTAVTPYKKICFSAFYLEKRKEADNSEVRINLDLPSEIKALIK